MMGPSGDPERRAAARWFALAIGSLILAGALSLLLVIGRMPPFDRLGFDPLFFRRCLVVHVDLALIVWFYAFVAALSFTLGASSITSRASVGVSAMGVLAMVLSAWARGHEPVLANYVPMIAHPVFAFGLLAFGVGVVASFLDARLLADGPTGFFPLPEAARPGLRATGVAIILAALTFATSYAVAPDGLTSSSLYELANWDGGHVLQFAISCALGSTWIMLVGGALGRSPIERSTSLIVFAAGLAPWLVAPLLAARGIQSIESRETFTHMMQLGIFPMMLVLLVLLVRAIVRARTPELLRDARIWGFGASAGLTVLGWGLGAAIRGPNTMIPAHYHASIGAVTAAFMTLAYPLLAHFGHPTNRQRVAKLQPLAYGIGQMIFAAGFAFAGAHGMARKVYGAEQHARTAAETFGLIVMGAGGLVAVSAGLTFLFLVISAWRGRRHGIDEETSRSEADGQPVAALGARRPGPVRLLHDLGLGRAREHETRGAAVRNGGVR